MTNNINLPISDNDVWFVKIITATSNASSNLENELSHFLGRIGNAVISLFKFTILILLSPLLMVLFLLSVNRIKNLAKRFKEAELLLTKEAILTMTFNDVKKMEKMLKLFSSLFLSLNEKDTKEDIIARIVYVDVLAINNSIKQILNTINSTYKVNAMDFFDNESDYEEYIKEIRAFDDVWNYPSTEAEQRIAFNHNKDVAKNAIC